MPSSTRSDLWFVAAVLLLIALTAYTRLPAPWRFGLINDEMHHLESWRNRYRTDDIYPIFLPRVESSGLLAGERLQALRKLYESSPLVQRALIVLVDPQPPLFPVMAEIIEASTRSSLIAARIPSAIASILAIILMYRLGRALRDRTLGLWLATLVAIGTLPQMFATVARPYALAQFAAILALYVFVREQQVPRRSPWRLWLAVLFAQSTQWMVWSVVGPLVAIDLFRRFRAGSGAGVLVRQTWWYVAVSLGLAAIMVIQLKNPTITNRAGMMQPLAIWYHISLASPFAALDPIFSIGPRSPLSPLFSLSPISVAGILLFCLTFFGIGAVAVDTAFLRGSQERGRAPALALPVVRVGLIAAMLGSLGAQIFIGSSVRFMMTYILLPSIFAGIGAHWLARTERASRIALVGVLVLFSVLRIGWPDDPYDRVFWGESDYAQIAERVREALGPDDIWCSYPYFRANCLYRFADLPTPRLPPTERELARFLATVPRPEGAVVFYGKRDIVDRSATLRRAPDRWEFPNDHVVVRIPAKPRRW